MGSVECSIDTNWEAESDDQWLVPFGGGVGKIVNVGNRPVDFQVQGFYNAIHPENLPYPDWSLRLQVKLLFPK